MGTLPSVQLVRKPKGFLTSYQLSARRPKAAAVPEPHSGEEMPLGCGGRLHTKGTPLGFLSHYPPYRRPTLPPFLIVCYHFVSGRLRQRAYW